MNNEIKQPKQPKEPEINSGNEAVERAQASKLFGTNLEKPKQPKPYKKPKIDNNFYSTAYKDGYKIKNGSKEARLGKGRMDDIIDYYGVWDDKSDYSRGYMAYVNPKDFLDLSYKFSPGQKDDMDQEFQSILNNKNIDLDKVNASPYSPFLELNFDNNEILNHDGRHRMAAFAGAGLERVPVVIKGAGNSFRKDRVLPKKYLAKVIGQLLNGNTRAPGKEALDLDLVPINYKNAASLWEKFGYEEDDN